MGGGGGEMNSQQELYKRCYFLFLDNSLLVKSASSTKMNGPVFLLAWLIGVNL